MEKKDKKKKSRFLEPLTLGEMIEGELSSIDLDSSFGHASSKAKKLFLRTFSAEDLYRIMKRVKLLSHLAKLGLDDIQIKIDVDETLINYFKVYFKEVKPDNLLLELRLSESKFLPDMKFFKPGTTGPVVYDMVVIEWLSAQSPRNTFTPDRPQLPGQKKPGLGVLDYYFEMMYVVAREVSKDGFLDIPDHVHGAMMYAKKFKFFDPAHEGALRAMMRDLQGYSMSDISWGILTETIIEEYKNKPQPYKPSEQVFYVSHRLRKYFHSRKYRSVFKKYYKRKHFRFEFEAMQKKREEILRAKEIENL